MFLECLNKCSCGVFTWFHIVPLTLLTIFKDESLTGHSVLFRCIHFIKKKFFFWLVYSIVFHFNIFVTFLNATHDACHYFFHNYTHNFLVVVISSSLNALLQINGFKINTHSQTFIYTKATATTGLMTKLPLRKARAKVSTGCARPPSVVCR